ncbi:PAS domain S-box protein, partial [Acidiphilium sp.]|uniref:PAS domain S-box protein n=1 Tax=Acidiphilium sp. TaxID=527 RepID=UPI003CFD2A13
MTDRAGPASDTASETQGGLAPDVVYRAVFQSAVDFAIVATDRAGVIIDWNSGAEQIFGWSADEATGRHVGLIFTGDDRAQDRPGTEMRRALVSDRANDERWHLRKDGSRFWASGEMMPLRDQGDSHIGFLKILRDRTEQRAADATLREARGMNALILRSARDCIVVLDLDGHTLFVSDGGIESMEITDVDAVLGRSWLRVWQGDDLRAAEAALAEARNGGIGRFQGFCATHAGTPKWWDVVISPLPGADGLPERLVSVGRDITQIREVQQRQSELFTFGDRLRALADIDEIAYCAAETLARTLGVSRAGYGVVDPLAETIDIQFDFHHPDVEAITGRLRFRDFGDYVEALKRGEIVVVDDVEHDDRTRANAERLRAIGVRAMINLPIFERGQFVALYYAARADGHHWTSGDVDFMRSVADRTRAVIERLRAQQALEALNATLEQQVEQRTRERDRAWKNAQDLQVVLDGGGMIRAVNDAWTTILGWPTEALIGRSVLAFVHPEDRAASEARLQMVASQPLPFHENRYLHRDGSWRWIAWVATAEAGLIYASGRHITVEKRQAEALEHSVARLRTIFGTSSMAQGLLTPTGTLLETNAASLLLIGTTLDAVVGMPFAETPWFAATPGMPARVAEMIATAATGQVVTEEVTVILPGGPRILDLSIRPVLNVAGEVIALVPEAADLTERRQVEEQLRQAQKMQAIGQLTGGIAHDFNNLLTGISGNLELLQLRLGQRRYEALDTYLAGAQSAASRAAALTQRLLAFSRRQTLTPQPIDLNRLVTGMEEMIDRTVGPAIDLELALGTDVAATLCDPNQLENALLNLCINARDAMPDGGRLTVETANRHVDARSGLSLELPAGDYVSLCVTDNGTGMSAAVIARAFDPFFTTKPIGLGTGLGLSMVYGFARQSGGQVRIYSEPGQGSSVCLYLPRHTGAADAPAAVTPVIPLPVGTGEMVLIVDDEPSVRMLVGEALAELGYGTIEAEDGAAGLAILQSAARIDLLITDVGLPGGMNGRQMADAARQYRPDLNVLFITGYAENALVSHGHLDAG